MLDFFQLAKPGSLQQGASSGGFNMSAVSESNKSKSKDTLSTCDSSSEVSDEGYKSSQGNVGNSASPNHGGRTSIELSGKSGTNLEASSHEGGKNDFFVDLLREFKICVGYV